MKTSNHAAGLLQQIAEIQAMEPGKLCPMGQGKSGPFYNLQCRENGKPVSRYVPQAQVETVRQNTENYRTFQTLVSDYAGAIIQRTREERMGTVKKRPAKRCSPSRTANSSPSSSSSCPNRSPASPSGSSKA